MKTEILVAVILLVASPAAATHEPPFIGMKTNVISDGGDSYTVKLRAFNLDNIGSFYSTDIQGAFDENEGTDWESNCIIAVEEMDPQTLVPGGAETGYLIYEPGRIIDTSPRLKSSTAAQSFEDGEADDSYFWNEVITGAGFLGEDVELPNQDNLNLLREENGRVQKELRGQLICGYKGEDSRADWHQCVGSGSGPADPEVDHFESTGAEIRASAEQSESTGSWTCSSAGRWKENKAGGTGTDYTDPAAPDDDYSYDPGTGTDTGSTGTGDTDKATGNGGTGTGPETGTFDAEITSGGDYPVVIEGSCPGSCSDIPQINVMVSFDGIRTSHYTGEVQSSSTGGCLDGACTTANIDYSQSGSSFTLRITDGKTPTDATGPITVNVDLLALRNPVDAGWAGETDRDTLNYVCGGSYPDRPSGTDIALQGSTSTYQCLQPEQGTPYVADLQAQITQGSSGNSGNSGDTGSGATSNDYQWGEITVKGGGERLQLPGGCENADDSVRVTTLRGTPTFWFYIDGENSGSIAVQGPQTVQNGQLTKIDFMSMTSEGAKFRALCPDSSVNIGLEEARCRYQDSCEAGSGNTGGTGSGVPEETVQQIVSEHGENSWQAYCAENGYNSNRFEGKYSCIGQKIIPGCAGNTGDQACVPVMRSLCEDLGLGTLNTETMYCEGD